MKKALKGLNMQNWPAKWNVIPKGDPRVDGYRRDAVMGGNPDAVARPRDWQEVAEMVKWCGGTGTPLTVCGARTSMTGASVAEGGLLLTTDHFNKVIDIGTKDGEAYAIVEPGLIVGEFQKIVEEHGFHYPVVPTSCGEAFIGGTVGTNATGEDFYKYGPTRGFVQEIEFIRADGSEGIFKRNKVCCTNSICHREPTKGGRGDPVRSNGYAGLLRPEQRRGTRNDTMGGFTKGLGGYFLGGEEIDQLIGSEGTLVVFKRVRLQLLPYIPKIFIIVVPFGTDMDALAFIDDVNKKGYAPRALEYMDSASMEIMRMHPTCPAFSANVKALVYVKDEYFCHSRESGNPDNLSALDPRLPFDLAQGTRGDDSTLQLWFERISNAGYKAFIEETIVATTDKQRAQIHDWRHHIPAIAGEKHEALEKKGGGKVAGDWWVPKEKMLETLRLVYKESAELGLPFIVFGHLGDGHPHINYFCATPDEKARAEALVVAQCRRAAASGGGVAGEHGLGKLGRSLLSIQYTPESIAKMRSLKERFDPNWILGRGNILEFQDKTIG